MKLVEIYEAPCECVEVFVESRYLELEAELTQARKELDDARAKGDEELGYDLLEIIDQIEYEMEELDTLGEAVLSEAAIRQFKRVGQEIRKRYRCVGGPKDGKLVATPSACAQRKEPKKVRQGRKVMRSKKGVIKRKSAISKRKQISRLVSKMNKRLAGKL